MNETVSRESILNITTRLLAEQGAAGLGMRDIAKDAEVTPSTIYHYFVNKDQLLKSTFDEINTRLGIARRQLPPTRTAAELLLQRIHFQLEHTEEVVAVLKYYLAYRHTFAKSDQGILPEKAYLHMLEVLQMGELTGEFYSQDPVADAQVMTHAINGFLLEYYPERMTETEKNWLALRMYHFLIRALKGGERR